MKKNVTKTVACKTEPGGVATEAGIKKQFLKCRPTCKVTFKLPKEAAPEAKTVAIMGDFNNWSTEATLMKKSKDGSFSATLELDCNREYRFRYLIDGSRWENDWNADRYEKNPFGGEDSVITI